MERETKVLFIAASLYLSYFAFFTAILPIRATSDEKSVLMDIHKLFETGAHHGVFNYLNGPAFQAGITAILHIFGLSPTDTEMLSPIIGGITLGIIAFILWLIYRKSIKSRPWWGAIGFFPSLLVLPGLINRLKETSHKTFTFSLVFLGLYLAFCEFEGYPDWRRYTLIVLTLVGLSTLNFIWGFIYGSLISMVLIFGRYHPTIAFFPSIISYIIATALPSVLIEKSYFLKIATAYLITNNPNGDTSDSAEGFTAADRTEGLITAWPTIEIGQYTISIWFIWASGVFFTAFITAIGVIHVCLSYIRSREVTPLGLMLVIISVYHAFLTVMLFFAGDIATVKRMIILPGLFGVLYVCVQLASSVTKNGFENSSKLINASTLLIGMTILLILFAGLSTQRVMLDGNQKPLDTFATESELAQVNWLSKYQHGCSRGVGKVDEVMGAKFHGEQLPIVSDVGVRSQTIYSSGSNSVVLCSQI